MFLSNRAETGDFPLKRHQDYCFDLSRILMELPQRDWPEGPEGNDETSKEIKIKIKGGRLELSGHLSIPSSARGVVIFAHGSGSSRFSPRNKQVSQVLNSAGFGTLLFDLLTEEEAFDQSNIFNIPLLADRLTFATEWLRNQKEAFSLPFGFFGASTGAGAALWAAASLQKEISAIVSRGGRPDLAIPKLHEVSAPTLLIVGGEDVSVIGMNQEALQHIKVGSLVIVPGATHLFEEPGALECVSQHALEWFRAYLGKKTQREAA